MNTIDIKEHHDTLTVKSAANLFPTDAESQLILEQRSNNLATKYDKINNTDNLISYVKFKLGTQEHYGISFELISEIIQKYYISPLPLLPKYLSGVINRRGMLISVIDLKLYLNINQSTNTKNQCIIILKCNNQILGLLVDEIIGSNQFDPTKFNKKSSPIGIIDPKYILGIHLHNTTILNMKNIVDDLSKELQHLNNK